jgi:hypothetical protein
MNDKFIQWLRYIESEYGFRFRNSACGGISAGADYDCDSPIVPGVNQRLILGNLDDVLSVTYDTTVTTLIKNITLKSGKQAYSFEGIRQSLSPSYEMVPGATSIGYMHMVNFLAFQIDQSSKDNYEKMGLGKLFAVIENKNAQGNGNSLFEVYGLNVGMEANAITRNPSDVETSGAFSISLQTSENEGKEPKMPQSWFDTDYATTLAKVEALLTPAP